MAAANPLWGAPRIHGELGKLGVDVSERTVSRLLRRPRRPPSQTWRTFLTNHVATLASIDFLTVPTLTGRVLFVFIVLMHHRRQIVHVNVTEHPTAAWTAQQLIDAFPDDRAPRWLLRDRDAIYGDAFRRRIAGMGIGEVVSSPASPWQNPYAERLIGSLRRECLDHVIVFNEQHLRRVLTAYLTYYHGSRTHLSLQKDAPIHRVSDLWIPRRDEFEEAYNRFDLLIVAVRSARLGEWWIPRCFVQRDAGGRFSRYKEVFEGWFIPQIQANSAPGAARRS